MRLVSWVFPDSSHRSAPTLLASWFFSSCVCCLMTDISSKYHVLTLAQGRKWGAGALSFYLKGKISKIPLQISHCLSSGQNWLPDHRWTQRELGRFVLVTKSLPWQTPIKLLWKPPSQLCPDFWTSVFISASLSVLTRICWVGLTRILTLPPSFPLSNFPSTDPYPDPLAINPYFLYCVWSWTLIQTLIVLAPWKSAPDDHQQM